MRSTTLRPDAVTKLSSTKARSPPTSAIPGGPAVNCEVMFAQEEAAAHFPAGTQFDLWENGRKGYGTTLRVLSS